MRSYAAAVKCCQEIPGYRLAIAKTSESLEAMKITRDVAGRNLGYSILMCIKFLSNYNWFIHNS